MNRYYFCPFCNSITNLEMINVKSRIIEVMREDTCFNIDCRGYAPYNTVYGDVFSSSSCIAVNENLSVIRGILSKYSTTMIRYGFEFGFRVSDVLKNEKELIIKLVPMDAVSKEPLPHRFMLKACESAIEKNFGRITGEYSIDMQVDNIFYNTESECNDIHRKNNFYQSYAIHPEVNIEKCSGIIDSYGITIRVPILYDEQTTWICLSKWFYDVTKL